MKHCTACQHLFSDQVQVCPTDNTPLRVARELEPGMIVRNKYVILERIGAGGMATVYRAKHRLLNEMRAVKVVSARFTDDQDFLKRFRHEAAIARKLRHENAVWVEDLDEIEDGRPFIAMELLQGNDLRKVIKEQGPLAVERSLKLGAQVASALGAAHKLGIVHRDIKPDNILITRDDSGNEIPKVLDFGIAKAKETALQGGYTATRTGIIIGTPEYMSPEQAEAQVGDRFDGRSDIYSLGIVLYEMLTGQLPFKSDTPLGMCLHHMQTIPRPPHEMRPDLHIPESVSAILMKALEKKREQRFQSAQEMQAALRDPSAWAAKNASFAPTMIASPSAPANNYERTVALDVGPKAAAAARQQPVASAPQVSPAAPVISQPAKQIPAARPVEMKDEGQPRRIVMVAIVVIICALAGYFLLTATQRRNAALHAHDSVLRDLIVEKIQSSPSLKDRNLTVVVNSDVATLSGSVALPGDKDAAANLARSVAGVSDVINNIEVVGMPVSVPKPPETTSPPPTSETAHQNQAKTAQNERKPVPDIVTEYEAEQKKVSTLVRQGNAELEDGKYAAAINHFQQALQLDRNNSAARSGINRAKQAEAAEKKVLDKTQ